jgi:hypothetical protein
LGEIVVQRGDLLLFNAGARNLGGSDARDASVTLTIPLGLSWRAGPCTPTSPQRAVCALGDIPSGGVSSAPITLAADAGLGWRSVQLVAATESPDSQDANDVSSVRVAVTGLGAQVVPVNAPRPAFLEACFGTGLTSFSVCTPASLLSSPVLLLPDGGVDTLDAGFDGLWSQSPHQRNIGFRFYFGAIFGRQYAGASTTATCFEGVIDTTTTFETGAFRLCLQ